MVEAVLEELQAVDGEPDAEDAYHVIAAVFDNLPREVMAEGGERILGKSNRPLLDDLVDAAISAARAAALGSAKGDA